MATDLNDVQIIPLNPGANQGQGFLDPQVQDIVTMMDRQRQDAEAANKVLVDTIQQGAQQMQNVDRGYQAAVTALQGDATGISSEAIDAYNNIERVKANPLLEIVGIFNPKYNTEYQASRIDRAQFQMQTIKGRTDQLSTLRNNARQQVQDAVEYADKTAGAVRSNLVNTQIQYQTVAGVLDAQLKVLNTQLAGMSDEELAAASKNPPPGLPKGLLQEKVRTRQKERLAIEAARIANQNAELDASAKSMALAGKKRDEFLRVAQTDTLKEMEQHALQNGGVFADPEQPNLTFSLQEIRAAQNKRNEEDRVNDATWVNYALASTNATAEIGAAGDMAMRLGMMATGDPQRVLRDTVKTADGRPIPLSNIDPSSLPTNARASFEQLQNYLATATQSTDPDLANTAIVEGAKKVDEINKAVQAYTKDLPKDRRAAADEYIRTGRVRSASAAADVVVSSSLNAGISPVSHFALTPLAMQLTQAINNIESQSFGRAGPRTYTADDLQEMTKDNATLSAADLLALLQTQKTTRNSTELVRQAIASMPVPPAMIVMSQVEQGLLSQVVNKLAQEQPDVWGKMFATTGTQQPLVGIVQDAHGNSAFSKVEFLREVDRRNSALIAAGKLPPESNMAETLFSLLQANAQQFVDSVLTPQDDVMASYLTVAGLSDPGESRRFFMNQILSYPPKYREAQALNKHDQNVQQERLGPKGLPPGTIGGPSLRFGK